jgi:PAS domain S-box-containing protein
MRQAPREFHPEFEALRREYNDFRYYLPDALIEVDLDTLQVLYLNRQAELLFGYSARDVESGLNGGAIVAPEEMPRTMQILQGYIGESRASGEPYTRSGTPDIYEQRLRRKDGSTFWAETQTSFVLDTREVPVRMRTIVRDISARKQAQLESELALARLRAAAETR